MPHDKWGETPCAFIELAPGQQADATAMKDWCRQELAAYKVPGRFIFKAVARHEFNMFKKSVQGAVGQGQRQAAGAHPQGRCVAGRLGGGAARG